MISQQNILVSPSFVCMIHVHTLAHDDEHNDFPFNIHNFSGSNTGKDYTIAFIDSAALESLWQKIKPIPLSYISKE